MQVVTIVNLFCVIAGITCMYASTHADAAQAAAKYGLQQQHTSAEPATTNAPSSAVQSAAVDIADTAVHAEVPAGPSVALSNPNKPGADNSAETGAAPVASKLTGQCEMSMSLMVPEPIVDTRAIAGIAYFIYICA